MKHIFIIILATTLPILSFAQWISNGDSYTTGRIGIGTQDLTDYDIEISRSSANAGLKIFNSLATGRSLLLFGAAFGGKYGYLAHHGQSHDAGIGYTQTFKASSTTLTGSDAGGVGIVSAQDIRFNAGGEHDSKQRMIINASGDVGIGTMTPTGKLHVAGTVYSSAIRTNAVFSGSLESNNANFIGSEGYWALRTATNNSFNLDVYNQGSVMAAMTVLQNGNIGIGSISPDAKLTVKGAIHTEEVTVDMTVPGPDYVFEENYNLLSLAELEAYIKVNKHLPEVPSAKEMEANGFHLKEMNLLLLKKVEELTLHLIEQKKVNDDQQKMISTLMDKVSDLDKK